MDDFLNNFSRQKDQEIVDYNLAWAREIRKAEKASGDLAPKWKAHLYLEKMRMPPQSKSQIFTASLGDFTVEALQKAALTAFPNVRNTFGKTYPKARTHFPLRHNKKHR